ncbi:uncharacterized protein LOC112901516 isoform X1 [Panicum hallii]|nr:uncharacterized protein LOC112901516 isoform X1 [Panicum hallii]
MDEWRCRRHPPLPGGGVCPHCLRDRLLRLCPECARARPCACSSSGASSPSSSSSPGAGAAGGRNHSLAERERRVARSRSVVAAHGGADDRGRSRSGVWGWVSFRKPPQPPTPDAAAGCKDVEQEYDDAVALARSRSVSAEPPAAEPKAAGPPKAGGWGRLIPGKIKALRSRKYRGGGGDWRDSAR